MKNLGSKRRLMKYLKPILQGVIDEYHIENYIEPFVGGANVINEIDAPNKYGYDNNQYVIALYNAIQKGWEPWNDGTRESITKEKYKEIRQNKDGYPPELVGLVGTLGSYCGKWFAGYAVEKSGYDNFSGALNGLAKEHDKYCGTIFAPSNYKDIIIPNNSLVYCDPPYESSTGYKERIDYVEYWQWVRDNSQKSYVICSEYHAPNDFKEIFSQEQTTTISGEHKKGNSKKAAEKLFIYKQSPYVSRVLKIADEVERKFNTIESYQYMGIF